MLLRLPNSLHYPITITKIEKRVGEFIQIDDQLFLYSYKTKRQEARGRYDEEDVWVERELTTHFASTLEGTIAQWRVWDGDVIPGPCDVCEITEECPHEVQFNGLCTNCGKDLTREMPGVAPSIERAPIRMAHDTPHLTISQDEAAKIDEESKQRLLAARKLSLVVDLDQTIIHAGIDPTIGEWQRDPENPNHSAVKDVPAFQLLDDPAGMRGCWYYIKLRPGLTEFLEHISQLYELHIYTMGTRQYARQIVEIVDPEHKFFGDRILSRDESGSMSVKNLERLFPIDTKMVVIIDDRGDVWKWSANLVRVTPFDFWVGVGDINSSFLPKKEEIQATTSDPAPKVPETVIDDEGGENSNGVAADGTSTLQNGTSALENILAMSGSNDPAARQEQTESQEKMINKILEEKPLERMQREQDEKDAAAEAAAPVTGDDEQHTNGESNTATLAQATTHTTDSDSDSSTESQSGTPKKAVARHSILKDDDEELIHLEAGLTAVHAAFFKEWDRRRISGKGGRVAALAGQKKAPLPDSSADDDGPANLALVPDVKRVMPAMKMRVLSGVVLVFSGVLPLGTDIQSADISTWAKTFGATVREEVGRDVTHVIAARAGTAKVKRAVKRGIKIVSTAWLFESMVRWRKLDERPYLLEGAGKLEDAPASSPTRAPETEGFGAISSDLMLSDSDDTDLSTDEDGAGSSPTRKRLKLDTALDGLDDDEEEYSPPTFNQEEYDKIQEELREFMGSDMDSESDNESVRSELSVRAKKRRRGEMEDGTDGTSSDTDGNVLDVTKKRPATGSRLKEIQSLASEKATSPLQTSTSSNSLSPPVSASTKYTQPSNISKAELSEEAAAAARQQRDDEQIEREQAAAESEDRQVQAEELDSDDEDERELEEMLAGGSDLEDEREHMEEVTDLQERWAM
ncbi:uncharacterized protein HMPREF1541_01928 [Cyphellophora europaea CBS 101466]|uniref:RNA polymerase II subunit A C-terminal domain phosphatase n=1 Tax=Cyphellophora europaea (strain CBS 101466) TaxID=1220924 RepID=W2S2F1_CYPE1|nr:uncharacterized protein HMPREF1541_01928 [Cyphellophora europaea CBS 101466]ETN42770.1 hypothetical protein HMPREF1541_01928 [Cyphellophora europaea CBS 101466]